MTAQIETQTTTLPLMVMGDGPNLNGQNWLTKLHLNWKTVHSITLNHSLEDVLELNRELFQQGLGMIEGVQAKLRTCEHTSQTPVF